MLYANDASEAYCVLFVYQLQRTARDGAESPR